MARHVLLVDDDRAFGDCLRGLLSMAGYPTVCMGSMEEAWAFLQGQGARAVITDNAMQGSELSPNEWTPDMQGRIE
jgi:DNA-binding NtrC family response regulator